MRLGFLGGSARWDYPWPGGCLPRGDELVVFDLNEAALEPLVAAGATKAALRPTPSPSRLKSAASVCRPPTSSSACCWGRAAWAPAQSASSSISRRPGHP